MSNETNRSEFEEWAKSNTSIGLDLDTEAYQNAKHYCDNSTYAAWEAWQAARERQWLPIESAPKNGRVILTWDGVNMSLCNWANCSEVWEQEERMGWSSGYDCSTMSHDKEYPTHWIPLPNPPTSEKI
jgi:hypothetical protein